MKLIGPYIYLIISLTLFSCGMRTAPEPYDPWFHFFSSSIGLSTDLVPISLVKINFRGDNLMFRWTLSTSHQVRQLEIKDATSDEETTFSCDPLDVTSDQNSTLRCKPPDSLAEELAESILNEEPLFRLNLSDFDIEEKIEEIESTSDIAIFRVNLFQLNSECLSCQPDLLGRILIDVAFDQITSNTTGEIGLDIIEESAWQTADIAKAAKNLTFYRLNNSFDLQIPLEMLNVHFSAGRQYLTVDYITSGGRISLPSSRLFPIQPQPLAEPKISIRKIIFIDEISRDITFITQFWEDIEQLIGLKPTLSLTSEAGIPSNSFLPLALPARKPSNLTIVSTDATFKPVSVTCLPPDVEFFLLLQWKLRQESLQHIIQKDGKIKETITYNGVNFYKIEKDDKEKKEYFINPEPLLNGSYWLTNFHDWLYARTVDKFGNESNAVLVFKGVY